MALMQWDEALGVGVAELDSQHRKLISMTVELNDAMKDGRSKDVLGKTVEGLFDYAGVHFATEEKYFDQFAYPRAPHHKREHQEFVERVLGFQKEVAEGHIALGIEIMFFLSDWLRNHIQGSDKAYAQFFAEKGLK